MVPSGMLSAEAASFLVSVGEHDCSRWGQSCSRWGKRLQDGTLSCQSNLNKEILPHSERQVAIQPFLPPHKETLERDANISIRTRTMYVFPIFDVIGISRAHLLTEES